MLCSIMVHTLCSKKGQSIMLKLHLESEATPVISSRPSRRKRRRPEAAFGSFGHWSGPLAAAQMSLHLSLYLVHNVKLWVNLGGDALNVLADEFPASQFVV